MESPVHFALFRTRRGVLAAALVTVLAIGAGAGGGSLPARAAPAKPSAPALPKQRSVPVRPLASDYSKPRPAPAYKAQNVTWPSGVADVRPGATAAVRAGSLPVWLSAAKKKASVPASVHVQAESRAAATAAGLDGVLLAVRPDVAGAAHLKISYASFKDAYGGDWASRLSLVALPACALTTPDVPTCRRQAPLASTNDTAAQTLEADLPAVTAAATTVIGATADSGGGNGDFSATSLKPAGSWHAGGNGDSFDWTYPIGLPPVPGGLTPDVALSYDSQSQDGLTSSTNNQASWVGDGWDYSPGFIERSYQSCHENPAGATKTWDECWSAKNTLTMSLNGTSSALILDGSGVYHPQDDGNEKIERLTGADNGAQGGEYWRVTTDDGIQYYFGENKLPGWATGKDATNSVSTVPVFETDSTRPCYNATFSKSYCQQAYRWNLDYVVDTHKDTIAYFYKSEQNYYASDLGTTANLPYTRDSYPVRIQYGQGDGATYSTSAAAQVSFTVNGRCDTAATGCAASTLTSSTAKDWPDVPYDATCASGATCKNQGPSFWSTVMLTGIQTQALVGTAETNVDSWSLNHSFPDPEDSQSTAALWLTSITRTGQDTSAGPTGTTAITLPETDFGGQLLANRVKTTNGYPPLTRMRLNTITTETGEKISVGYSTATTTVPSDPAQNTTLAYPEYWTPSGKSDPILDWFNKYVVTAVTEQDTTDASSNDDVVTTYVPVGTPAWHYDTDPLTPADRRTWNEWRGYEGMTVSTGNAPDPVTRTTYSYFRGMGGSFTDSRGDAAVTDADQYSGMTYETRVFNGSSLVSDSITDPWSSAATATDASGRHAYHLGSARDRVYTPLASGDTRETEADYTHDDYGRVTAVDDRGDTSTSADDQCSTTSYADNATLVILDAPDEIRTVRVPCAITPSIPGDVLSDSLTYYDGSTTLGAAPTHGDVTRVQALKSYDGTTPVYVTSTTVVDQYGRTTSTTDGENRTTATSYTPATGAEPTSSTVIDPLKYATTTTYDSLRDLPKSVTDPAGYVTTTQYDALGRAVAVYKPGRALSTTPSIKYAYTVSSTGPSLVDTYTLNHDASGYAQSESLYDSMLRLRETQSQTVGTGHVQTDTFYNTDGWVSGSTGAYYNGNPIGTTIAPAQAGDIDSEDAYVYDGAGRKTADIAYHRGDETWRTTTTYGGNFVTTVPPAGSTARTTVTDARGDTVLQRSYHAGVTPDYLHAAAGTYDDLTFTYDAVGQPKTETDAAGDVWSWSYDLLGEPTDAKDPDTGETKTSYDGTGSILSVTDGAGRQTTAKYDNDGRRTGLYNTTSTQTLSSANQLAGWTYDTVKKGMPASETSYSNGDTFTNTVLAYNLYGEPSAHRLTLTGTDAGLLPAAGYVISQGYALNGLVSSQTDAAIANLPQESTTVTYGSIDEPTALTGSSAYVTAVGYDGLGEPLQYTLGSSGYVNYAYDEQTRATTGIKVSGFGHSGDIDNVSYTYGDAAVSKGSGLLTKIVDQQDAGATTDTQCFTYDYAERLQQAWSATDGCDVTPAAGDSAMVGGPVAPYWQSWTYDAAGNRKTETDHGTSGDTTTSYAYPAAGASAVQPHTLTSTSSTGPDAAGHAAAYTYDPAGETIGITGGVHGDQAISWTTTGQIATDTGSGGTTNFAYDADGNQIIQRDPATTTLFLGDQQIVMDNSTKALTGTRSYSLGGTTIAVRSGTTVSYLVDDRQGTGNLEVNASSGAVTRRQYLPFGDVRGSAPIQWAGNEGYVGGTDDTNTGLETLGARQYDPSTGRFLSADPVFEAGDPNQLGGYDYAGNNPVVNADPSGLMYPMDGEGGGSSPQAAGTGGGSSSGHSSTTTSGNNGGSGGKKKHSFLSIVKTIGKDALDTVVNAEPGGCLATGSGGLGGALRSCRDQAMSGVHLAKFVMDAGACMVDIGCDGINKDMGCQDGWTDSCIGNVAFLVGSLLLGGGAGAAGDAGAAAETSDVAAETAGSSGDAVAAGGDDASAAPAAHKSAPAEPKESNPAASEPARPAKAEGCSFAAATQVLMADGSTKDIDKVKVGDQVTATDPTDGHLVTEPVTALHDDLDTDMADVTVADAHHHETTLHTTQNHPFWDATTQQWTRADHLHPGDNLQSATGAPIQVVQIHLTAQPHHRYNLTVQTLHTYYVFADSTPVLVHNCGGKATVRWDVDMEHATIRVEGGGRSLETEQVIPGWDGAGSPNGLPTTGARAESLGPNVIERTFDVPDAEGAMRAQQGSIGADLGGYDGIHNSCVTYCVSILRAGGVDIPAGARGMIALKKTLG